ncbi:MAG: hypothetical protein ACRCRZ_01995 [Metamycoplasmataceae bacterium]
MKNLFKILILPFIIVVIFVVTISFKMANPYKPAIYNYAQYVNPIQISKIQKNYSYKEYKSVEDFEYAIENNKAIGGVTSDYAIVNLIKNNTIQKIDFKNNFDIEDPRDFYTKVVNDQLSYYDQFLKGVDNDHDGKDDKMYEYVIPYFINNKVFAYNTNKIQKEEIDFSTTPLTHENILKIFQENKAKIFSWTNNKIENAIVGFEKEQNISTQITNNNYKTLVNNFANILKQGTSYNINDSQHNIFETDSDVLLQNVINPDNSIQVAYLYNGDALDAYYSEDNFSTVTQGTIKMIRPTNSLSILDAFVVSNSISKEDKNNLIKDVKTSLFDGKFNTKEELVDLLTTDLDEFDYDKVASMANFDYVNYTPTSKGEYDFIEEFYFLDEETNLPDEIALNFYKIEKANPIAPISKEVVSALRIYFKNILM